MMKALLMVSGSVHNADMYYATRFLSLDPFIYIRDTSGRAIIIVSPMEYERAKKESILSEIRSTADYDGGGDANERREELIILKALREEGIDEVEVPKYFPLYIADSLRKAGITVTPVEELELAKEREVKAEWEIEYIKKAQRACERAMRVAIEEIRNARIDGEHLVANGGEGEILTSERVRASIEHALVDSGCSCDGGEPIVACGKKASDPHFSGYGTIFAHEPIIIDIFPRLKSGRYFADMTRTVVRGEPSSVLKEMYEAVKFAQESAEESVREGVRCSDVHNLVCDIFEDMGYETTRTNAHANRGFIHSTGHGVGLDVHESPYIGDNDYVLREGNVITIEPGLYEPEVGGVRLEDMVLVRKSGCENLTRFEKRLVI